MRITAWLFRYLWFRTKQLLTLLFMAVVWCMGTWAVWGLFGFYFWQAAVAGALISSFAVWVLWQDFDILRARPPALDLEWLFAIGSPRSEAAFRRALAERRGRRDSSNP